jgi:hypothetical protein
MFVSFYSKRRQKTQDLCLFLSKIAKRHNYCVFLSEKCKKDTEIVSFSLKINKKTQSGFALPNRGVVFKFQLGGVQTLFRGSVENQGMYFRTHQAKVYVKTCRYFFANEKVILQADFFTFSKNQVLLFVRFQPNGSVIHCGSEGSIFPTPNQFLEPYAVPS